jgi:hypothetical protein
MYLVVAFSLFLSYFQLGRRGARVINSSWVIKNAPECHRFIRKHIRSKVGAIDWDTVTNALEPKYQRLWTPRIKFLRTRRNQREISLILNKYRDKLYVFVAQAESADLQVRDRIAIALVRLAQSGNLLARDRLMELIQYTVDTWLERYSFMSRWRGREDGIRDQICGCIRRYRYSGSFFRYVFRTLECAGRGLAPTLPFNEN